MLFLMGVQPHYNHHCVCLCPFCVLFSCMLFLHFNILITVYSWYDLAVVLIRISQTAQNSRGRTVIMIYIEFNNTVQILAKSYSYMQICNNVTKFYALYMPFFRRYLLSIITLLNLQWSLMSGYSCS